MSARVQARADQPARAAPEAAPAWHALSVSAVLDRLHTAETGLGTEEAARRLREQGPNEVEGGHQSSPWGLLVAQFKSVLVLILVVAVVLSALMGHALEAVVIAAILLFAVILGFVQEHRAERAIEGLRRLAAPVAAVLRDGEERDCPARDLVPGDVVILEAGTRVPANGRLIQAVNLKVDESALTRRTPLQEVTTRCAEKSLVPRSTRASPPPTSCGSSRPGRARAATWP